LAISDQIIDTIRALRALVPFVDALTQVGYRVRQYGSFRNAVVAIVLTYIVNAFVNLSTTAINAVQLAFEPVADIFPTASGLLGDAFSPAAIAITESIGDLNTAFRSVAADAGPVGIIVLAAVATLLVIVTYRLVIGLIGELPGGSTVTSLLGVD